MDEAGGPGEPPWMLVLCWRRHDGVPRRRFLPQSCLRSMVLECGALRLKSAVRIVIPGFTPASTAIHDVNRGEPARVSTGMSYDATPASPAGRIILLRPSHRLQQL